MHYQYKVKSLKKVRQGLAFLRNNSVQGIYEFEDSNGIIIGGFAEKISPHPSFLELISIEEETINWDTQWESKVIKVAINNKDFFLESGPGFGDAGHPTTKLCLTALELLQPESVLDIGSGSGILSIASLIQGAKSVISIEIDDNAIVHHKKNLSLNNLPENVIKKTIESKDLNIPNQLVVMNMILSEQKIVFSSFPELIKSKKTWYVSGILGEDRDIALKEYEKLGFSDFHIDHLDKWCGILMKRG